MTQRLVDKLKSGIACGSTLGLCAFVCFLLSISHPSAKAQTQSPKATTAEASSHNFIADLTPEKAISRELSGTEVHTYRVALVPGQCTNIVVEQRGIDVVVQVLDNNKVAAEIDSESRKQGQEDFVLVADSSPVYELQIKAKYPKNSGGNYEIVASTPRSATEQDRLAYTAHKLLTQANAFDDEGKYDDAIEVAQQALEAGEKSLGPENAFVGELAMRLGGIQQTKGDNANAEQMLLRAINISEKSLGKDSPQGGMAEFNLALVYRSTNDDVKAEGHFQKALEAFEKSLGNDHPDVAMCLVKISLMHQQRGDFRTATEELQRAIVIGEKSLEPTDSLSLNLLNNLGNLYLDEDDYDHAEAILEKQLTAAEQKYGPDHPALAPTLQNIGSIARVKKQFPRALEFLFRAEKIREKSLGLQHPQTAALFINIGNVYRDEDQYAKAIEFYHKALDILETSAGPYHDWTLMALSNLTDASISTGDLAHAVEYEARTEQVVERKIDLNLAVGSERQMSAYNDWLFNRTDRTISFHVMQDPNDPAALKLAALAALQRQARVLDALSGTSAALRQRLKPEDQKLLDDLSDTDAQLARVALTAPKTSPEEYTKRLTTLEQRRESLESEITRISAGYFEHTDPVTLPEISAAIPEHAVLVEFAVYHPYNPNSKGNLYEDFFGDPRYVVYLIFHDGSLQWKDLGKTKEIDPSLNALRQALRDPERTDVKQLARTVDEKVFQPIRPLVGNATHLLISPDGELGLVPFEAFVEENGHYLIERYSISYLSSGRDLLRMHVERPAKSGPLVVANPFFGEPSTPLAEAEAPKLRHSDDRRRSITTASDLSGVYFAPLSGTAQEARSIQQLFPDAKVVTGQQATTSYLKQVDAPSILHIATHGFFLEDPTKPPDQPAGTRTPGNLSGKVLIENPLLRSGLALAGANANKNGKDDGILTALEASNLNLWGTKLVTLSACDTGVGEVKTGEGIYGFRRAFFRAGAETLVMSLWPVSDNVTREMMTAYYTGLKQGLGRGEALHQAELAMLRKKGRQHPFYWASFIQSGDWTSLNPSSKTTLQSATH